MTETATIDYKALFEKEQKTVAQLQQQLGELQYKLDKFTRMLFGARSEKFIPAADTQLSLDMPVDSVGEHCKLNATKEVSYTKTTVKTRTEQPDLKVYMDALPKVVEVVEPEAIPEGAIKVGVTIQQSLEMTPATLFVKEKHLVNYKVVDAATQEESFVSAPASQRAVKLCIAGASVLTQILVDKYHDALPVYRQQARFERAGAKLPYNTLLGWAAKAIDHIDILYESLRKMVLQSGYLQADETGLKIFCSAETQNMKKLHDGWLWA